MALPEAAWDVFGDRAELVGRYVDILTNRGIAHGLIGPKEADRLWERHIFNSAALAKVVSQQVKVLDVGSGAGLPGVVLALARPDLSVTLLEPLLRRYTFLVETLADLGLADQIAVIRGRAEDLRASFPVVTARAVAPLGRLVGWTEHIFRPAGRLLALKGSSAAAEVADTRLALSKLGLAAVVHNVSACAGCEATNVVEVAAESILGG